MRFLPVFALCILLGGASLTSCGGEEPPPPPPAEKEPTPMELAQEQLDKIDAELRQLYGKHSMSVDDQERADLQAKIEPLEAERKVVRADIDNLRKAERKKAQDP